MIEGVSIIELKKIPDERGKIMHMLKATDAHFEKFGEVYFATAYPNVVKGWHEHTKQVQFYACIKGMIKLVLFDNRPDSKTYQELMELFIGEDNYKLVRIPTGVINGWKCISEEFSIVANCATIPHEPNEMLRYDPHGEKVPYNWKRIDK